MLKLARSQTTLAATAIKSFNSIPGPKAFPFVGSVPYYLPFIGKYDPMNVVSSGILKYKEYGPIVKERLISHDAILIYDPVDIETLFRHAGNNRRSHTILGHIRHNSEDHVNGGLLYEDGEPWAHLRTTSQQSLTAKTFEESLPKFDEITCRFVNKIGGSDPVMRRVIEKDFLLGVLAHSSDAVAYMLFGFEWDSLSDILNEDALSTRIIHSSAYFNRNQAPMDHGFMLWKRVQGPMYAKMKKCSEDVDIVPEQEVKRRLQDTSLAEGPGILNSWIRGGRRDYKTMITVLADFLLAGIDTTSYTLAFVLYNLSANKRVQDKLVDELRKLDPDIRKPISLSMETLSRATYLKRVVKESMRLFPVSVGTSRVLEEPCVIGGYNIPANITAITMNQVTCRLEEYVDRPNDFIPERFEPDSEYRKLRPFTLLPFGHGPRACIGRRVAELSMYSFVFRLLRRYEIEWIGTKELGCFARSITEPDGPLLFRFTPRTS